MGAKKPSRGTKKRRSPAQAVREYQRLLRHVSFSLPEDVEESLLGVARSRLKKHGLRTNLKALLHRAIEEEIRPHLSERRKQQIQENPRLEIDVLGEFEAAPGSPDLYRSIDRRIQLLLLRAADKGKPASDVLVGETAEPGTRSAPDDGEAGHQIVLPQGDVADDRLAERYRRIGAEVRAAVADSLKRSTPSENDDLESPRKRVDLLSDELSILVEEAASNALRDHLTSVLDSGQDVGMPPDPAESPQREAPLPAADKLDLAEAVGASLADLDRNTLSQSSESAAAVGEQLLNKLSASASNYMQAFAAIQEAIDKATDPIAQVLQAYLRGFQGVKLERSEREAFATGLSTLLVVLNRALKCSSPGCDRPARLRIKGNGSFEFTHSEKPRGHGGQVNVPADLTIREVD